MKKNKAQLYLAGLNENIGEETKTFMIILSDKNGNVHDSVEIEARPGEQYVNVTLSAQPDPRAENIRIPG